MLGPSSLSIPLVSFLGSQGILGIDRQAQVLPQTQGLSLEWARPLGQDAQV